MRIDYHRHFEKQYRKLPPKTQEKIDRKLVLFADDPFNYELNNHALTGKYSGCRSINITGDIRAIYEINGDNVIFSFIGTHHELYGK
jgi:addiction module RelE/StbE family toxin